MNWEGGRSERFEELAKELAGGVVGGGGFFGIHGGYGAATCAGVDQRYTYQYRWM